MLKIKKSYQAAEILNIQILIGVSINLVYI